MAISARVPSGLDTNLLIPEIWSKDILMALKSNLIVAPTVNHRYSNEIRKRGDTLYIPRSTSTAATEITVGTEGVQGDPFTTGLTLSIGNWYERPYTLDYMSEGQSQIEMIAVAKEEAMYSIRKQIDSSLCALFSALNGGTKRGTDGSAWTDSVMIAAVEEVDEADVPDENRVWIGDPSVKADIMGIDKFVHADYFAGDVIPSGGFRKNLYGAPLLITNNLTAVTSGTGSYGVYMHRDALVIAIQDNVKIVMVDQPLKHQMVVNAEALWGVAELRDTAGVPIYTRLA